MIWLNLDIASGPNAMRTLARGNSVFTNVASASIPAAPKNEQDENDDDEKCRVVHVDLLRWIGNRRSPGGRAS